MHRHTSGLATTSLAGRDSGCTPPSTNLHWVVEKQATMADFERKSAIPLVDRIKSFMYEGVEYGVSAEGRH